MPAEEHGQDVDGFPALVDLEPVCRTIERQVPEARQDVVVTLTPVRCGQDSARSQANFENSRHRMLDGLVGAFAEANIAFEQMVKNQFEITFGRR